MPDVIAYGEPMVEFNQRGKGDRQYLQGFGGDTSNAAIAAARQGASVGYLSAVGDDAFGAMFRELWSAEGVDHNHVKTDRYAPTAVYFVNHDEAGHHFSFLRKGSAASRYTPADLPEAYLKSAKVLHVSGISLAISDSACDAGLAAMEMARRAGVLVSFDTNLRLKLWPKTRARAIISQAIALSDICLPSLDDIIAMDGPQTIDGVIDFALGLGARTVVLKNGAAGAVVADGDSRTIIPPHACSPVDATGAGDCFAGAYLARMVLGDEPVAAARYAGVAAALSTEGYGAVAPIPTAAHVIAAMK